MINLLGTQRIITLHEKFCDIKNGINEFYINIIITIN